jgi:hypothetical protein
MGPFRRRSIPALLVGLGSLLGIPSQAGAGKNLQGRTLQGRTLQGRTLQGRTLQGRTLQGTESAVTTVSQVLVRGAPVEGLRLQGTVLSGSLGGKTLTGADFVGAVVVQRDTDGSTFRTTITRVQPDPQDKLGEVMLYTLAYVDAKGGAGENLCEPDPAKGQWAIPVYGSWDATGAHIPSTTQFMFACTSGVVAKCLRWGYRPWKTVGGRSLADHHQACTRMARADYCGDGTTNTENGTLIDLYDNLGIQTRSPDDLASLLLFDAAWTPRGAYCMSKERWLKLLELPADLLRCKAGFLQILPLVEASPVDRRDRCLFKRSRGVSRGEVLIDNQSGLNIKLLP